ncbi:MAG: hypothetical protein Q7S28_04460 [bacterium]|nr:hypothetical protein [bacterium]
MSNEKVEGELNPERVLSREEVLSQIRSRCEGFEIERELEDADGIYLLEVKSSDNTKRYIYQRKGSFSVGSKKIDSFATTIIAEDLDDGYARTIADYNSETNEWVDQ